MNNPIVKGGIVKGRVTGIQPYGAFVSLGDQQGLIHISEITHGYVKDISDYIQVGDVVNVKVLDVDSENGKISLSLKALERPRKNRFYIRNNPELDDHFSDSEIEGFRTLKAKLKEWIEQSDIRQTSKK